MRRRNFLSGLLSLPLFRSIFRRMWGEKAFSKQMTDREEAGLRGPVKTCVKEASYPARKSLTTAEYGLDGRLLTTRTSNPVGGSEWVTTKSYDADGRLVKTSLGKSGEPATESLYTYDYTYDERGRLKEITNADGKGNRTSYRYDQQGRKTEVKTFGHEVLERKREADLEGAIVVGMSLWDAAQSGALEGGSVTTLYDDRDLPIELQILSSEGRVVSRFIRTYDANGRIMEENQIQENPEAMNKAMKAMMSGKNGTRKSFTYDSQGRVTEMRDRNSASDSVTTTSYNEHGDKSEEHMTTTGNLAFPDAYTINEDCTLIPDFYPPPPVPERTLLIITEYRYEYDQYGNWTERTVVYRQEVNPSESGEYSIVYRRTLTYF